MLCPKRINLPCALLLGSSIGSAQVRLNEIYVSHTGVDDREYVEIIGPASTSLSGHMVLVLEGENGSSPGTLDAAFDLSGQTIPDDGGGTGFIVAGDVGVTNVDVVIGGMNAIENGTETIYLIVTDNVAAVQALVSSVVTADCKLVLAAQCSCSVMVLDVVALVSDDYPDNQDVVFDSAPAIGPSAGSIPPGVFRISDYPGSWCADSFLDFDDVLNLSEPRTPGASNAAQCAEASPGQALCFGTGCPCGNDNPTAGCANSTGVGGLLTGSGSRSIAADDLVLNASQIPPNQQGLFYMGSKAEKHHFADGLQCALGDTHRFLCSAQSSGSGGTMSLGPGIVASALPRVIIDVGSTWYFHAWHRNLSPDGPCGTGSNLTHLYKVLFAP